MFNGVDVSFSRLQRRALVSGHALPLAPYLKVNLVAPTRGPPLALPRAQLLLDAGTSPRPLLGARVVAGIEEDADGEGGCEDEAEPAASHLHGGWSAVGWWVVVDYIIVSWRRPKMEQSRCPELLIRPSRCFEPPIHFPDIGEVGSKVTLASFVHPS